MYEYICPVCGAHLDPGERCDCEDQKQDRPQKETVIEFAVEKDGQLRIAV